MKTYMLTSIGMSIKVVLTMLFFVTAFFMIVSFVWMGDLSYFYEVIQTTMASSTDMIVMRATLVVAFLSGFFLKDNK